MYSTRRAAGRHVLLLRCVSVGSRDFSQNLADEDSEVPRSCKLLENPRYVRLRTLCTAIFYAEARSAQLSVRSRYSRAFLSSSTWAAAPLACSRLSGCLAPRFSRLLSALGPPTVSGFFFRAAFRDFLAALVPPAALGLPRFSRLPRVSCALPLCAARASCALPLCAARPRFLGPVPLRLARRLRFSRASLLAGMRRSVSNLGS